MSSVVGVRVLALTLVVVGVVLCRASEAPDEQLLLQLGSHRQTRQWGPPISAERYCEPTHKKRFGNKMDFGVAARLAEVFVKNQLSSTFFVVGLNDGSDVKDLMGKPWYDPTKLKIFGWELMPDTLKAANATLGKDKGGHEEVEIAQGAISDTDGQEVPLGAGGETGYVKVQKGKSRWATSQYTAVTQRLDTFKKHRGISEVSYTLIDTEGHEPSVIRGMNLESNRNHFLAFQYETGGTWADERRASDTTQEQTAIYLNKLGYSIFLMGNTLDGAPMLAPAAPQTFANCTCDESRIPGVLWSNALAVLNEAVEAKPWLLKAVTEMVSNYVADDPREPPH